MKLNTHAFVRFVLPLLGLSALVGCDAASAEPGTEALASFGTRASLESFSQEWFEANQRSGYGGYYGGSADAASASDASASPSSAPPSGEAAAPSTTPSSITNNQELGVDEGDIVKAHGDHLVILRRGRLFTVRVGDGALAPVSRIDAFAPGTRPAEWYDEMLVHGDSVLVTGYSYTAQATEVNRFTVDAAGRLAYRDTFFLRSGDYYSSRNYASRVVGNQFVLYAPIPLYTYDYDHVTSESRPRLAMPTMRRGHGSPWSDVTDFAHVYRPLQSPGYSPVMHTVIFCDLAAPAVSCHAEGIVGPSSRTFYVSQRAVYLWVNGPLYAPPRPAGETPAMPASPYGSDDTAPSAPPSIAMVYRFPLDGTAPGVAQAQGGPIDQFSLRESGDELQVLATPDSNGDGFWGAERRVQGSLALVRLPLRSFGARPVAAPASAYTVLPDPGLGWMSQNRFVGAWLLYGNGNTWVRDGVEHRGVYAHSLATRATQWIELPHSVDRIEALGANALVVGTSGSDLHFSSLALEATPRVASAFVRPNASQGETRSHGFFFSPESERSGLLGLPIRGEASPGYGQLFETSAEIQYLRVTDLRLSPLGSLRAEALTTAPDDHCVASCVDWYGNARPIFYRGRVFALLGYELVEGRVEGGTITETSRTDYSRF